MRTPVLSLAAVICLLPTSAPQVAPPQLDHLVGQVVECEEGGEGTKPPPWVREMPKARETAVSKEEVQIESADGTTISARVYLPDAYEGRLPTVLVMSPYHALLLYWKEFEDLQVVEWADCITEFLLPRGYAVVLADMRGTHNSDGCFDYGGPGDQQDGYATVQWIAAQKWSNGNVGMYGVSHPGMSQYAAAVTSPPALKAIIPIAPISSFYRYLYNGGVHYETNMLTPAAYEYAVAAPPPLNATAPNYAGNIADTSCSPPNVIRGMSLDGTFTDYWAERDYSLMAGKIEAAVFHVHGTLDENVKTDHFSSIWEALEDEGVVRKALIGPWAHNEPSVPYWHFTALRWYEHWLNGNDTGMMDEPRMTLIDPSRRVRVSQQWPAGGKRMLSLGASGGTLTPNPVRGTAGYQDVPMMPRNMLRSNPSARLIYLGTELQQPVRLSGSAVFDLTAAIDKSDTNFAVHLYDVGPTGAATYVTRGYLDARLRQGLDEPEPVEPGERSRYRIELHAREYLFKVGHHIEVLLASSDSCHWGVAPGCTSSGVVSDTTAASVTVYEGPGLTQLLLPIAPATKGILLN